MKCLKCKNKAVIKSFCTSCAAKLAEKNIRRQLRQANIRKNMKILVIGNLANYYLNKILTLPVKIEKKSISYFGTKQLDNAIFTNKLLNDYVKKHKIDKVVIEWTLDHEIIFFLKHILNNTPLISGTLVLLFKQLSIEDLRLISARKKIKFLPKVDPFLYSLLNKLEKKHPEIKMSMLSTIDELKANT